MEVSKKPIQDLTKTEFEEAYKLAVEKHGPKLDKGLVLQLALGLNQISQDKFNELIKDE